MIDLKWAFVSGIPKADEDPVAPTVALELDGREAIGCGVQMVIDPSINRMESDVKEDRKPESPNLFLTVRLPRGVSSALAASLQSGIEQAINALGSDLNASVLTRADDLAKLISGLTQPNAGLVEERVLRRKTMQAVFEQGEWLTSEDINRFQASPSRNKSLPASDWNRRGRVFAVSYDGKEYFARYQFDDACRPLPIIKEILQEIGQVADTWKTAAWFHYPSGWIADLVDGRKPIAPKDALSRHDEVLLAARRTRETYDAPTSSDAVEQRAAAKMRCRAQDSEGIMFVEERLPMSDLLARWKALQAGELKIEGDRYELNERGEIFAIPRPSNNHQAVVGQLIAQLINQLGAFAAPEIAVLTSAGILAPDVAWMPYDRWKSLAQYEPLLVVPEICAEVLSPSDVPVAMCRRIKSYLDGGAKEVIIVSTEGEITFWRSEGSFVTSVFDLAVSVLSCRSRMLAIFVAES